MKKIISLVILLFGVLMIYQFTVIHFKTSHALNYAIKVSDDVAFDISEEFRDNKYYLDIKYDNFQFIYKTDNSFNKSKNIVESIEYLINNNMVCIYPVYKNGVSSTIKCSDTSDIYSYDAVSDNNAAVNFRSSLIDKGYTALENKNVSLTSVDNLDVYYDNIDEYITVWNYQGFYTFHDKTYFNQNILSFDRYENTLTSIVDKYYISPIYIDNKLFEISGFYIFNLETNKKTTISLTTNLSNQTYINGIVNNKLYIFDKNNRIQLEINPKSNTSRIVGSIDLNCQYYNVGFETRNIYDFINNKITFNYEDYSNINSIYNYDNIYSNDASYFIYTGNTMYQVFKDNLNIKIKLFTLDDIKEVKVIDDNIYFIKKDTLYKYNDIDGISPLIVDSELQYNYSNIIGIYKK